MGEQKPLTATHLRYLLAMRELEGAGEGVRSVNMARALGIKKPSVHTMLNTFRDMGLVRKDAYGSAFFTREGRELADCYSRYYRAVAAMLRDWLPRCGALDAAAYALLAELPRDSLEDLARALEERSA